MVITFLYKFVIKRDDHCILECNRVNLLSYACSIVMLQFILFYCILFIPSILFQCLIEFGFFSKKSMGQGYAFEPYDATFISFDLNLNVIKCCFIGLVVKYKNLIEM